MSRTISGELAQVIFRCRLEARSLEDPTSLPPGYAEVDRQRVALGVAEEARAELHAVLTRELETHLRGDVYVDPLVVRPGSVEILAVIAGASLVVKNVADITSGIADAVEATRRALARLMGDGRPFQAVTSARVTEGSALVDAREAEAPPGGSVPVSSTAGPRESRLGGLARVVLPYYLGALLTVVLLVAILRFG